MIHNHTDTAQSDYDTAATHPTGRILMMLKENTGASWANYISLTDITHSNTHYS